MQNIRPITCADISNGTIIITVCIPYASFIDKFGEKHSARPSDWDSPGPVELWFFELPWGHKITLEYHLSIGQCNIYLDLLEIDAVLDYLQLRAYECHLWTDNITYIKKCHPETQTALQAHHLYRLGDNGNRILMHTYESFRVADYYRRLYEERGHKQLYSVELAAN
ncbi:MAG: hypothetical protein V4495_26850 [Pseudomonadota bacterium]